MSFDSIFGVAHLFRKNAGFSCFANIGGGSMQIGGFNNLTTKRAKWLECAGLAVLFAVGAPAATLAACAPSGATSGVHPPASGNSGVHTGVNSPPSTGGSGSGSKGSCSSAVNAGAENVVPSGAAHVSGAGGGEKSGVKTTALNTTGSHASAKPEKEVHARP
jgi:hypothetical protein